MAGREFEFGDTVQKTKRKPHFLLLHRENETDAIPYIGIGRVKISENDTIIFIVETYGAWEIRGENLRKIFNRICNQTQEEISIDKNYEGCLIKNILSVSIDVAL